MSKAMKIFFTLSILLNLLLIGTAGGMIARFWWGSEMHFSGMFTHVIEDIPDTAQRTVLIEKFHQMRSDNRAHGRIIREQRRLIRSLSEQEPFDIVAYDAAIASLLAAKRDIENSYANLLRDVVVALPVDERNDVLHWLYKGKRGGRGYHDSDDD